MGAHLVTKVVYWPDSSLQQVVCLSMLKNPIWSKLIRSLPLQNVPHNQIVVLALKTLDILLFFISLPVCPFEKGCSCFEHNCAGSSAAYVLLLITRQFDYFLVILVLLQGRHNPKIPMYLVHDKPSSSEITCSSLLTVSFVPSVLYRDIKCLQVLLHDLNKLSSTNLFFVTPQLFQQFKSCYTAIIFLFSWNCNDADVHNTVTKDAIFNITFCGLAGV